MLLGVKNNLPFLTILSKEQCEEIHQATLKVLEKIGVCILSQGDAFHPFYIHSANFSLRIFSEFI